MPRRKSYKITVTTRWKDGKLYLRHRDPLTGEEFMRLAENSTPSEIDRECWRWERQLEEQAAQLAIEKKRLEQQEHAEKVDAICTWKRFRERFRDEHLLSLAENSHKAFTTALDLFERYTPGGIPQYISKISETHFSQFASAYRASGVAETTIGSRVTHIRAAFEWGKVQKIISSVPTFPVVKRARKGQRIKPAKGRGIRDDEFPSILAAVDTKVTAEQEGVSITRWKRFLKGLWWSGLRLGEAISLSWNDSTEGIWVDMTRFSHPMLIIPGDKEKGTKDRIYPVAPEFAEMLWEDYDKYDRKPKGLVFPLIVRRSAQNNDRSQIGLAAASDKIIEICREAKVFTHYRGKGEKRKEQAAGAHDFRRTFGDRWARRVRPFVLQQMMRHESIETTEQYYVGLESEDLASDIYDAYSEYLKAQLRLNSPTNSPATNNDSHVSDEPGLGIS